MPDEDAAWIRQTLSQMRSDLAIVSTEVRGTKDHVRSLDKHIKGNGQPGLLQITAGLQQQLGSVQTEITEHKQNHVTDASASRGNFSNIIAILAALVAFIAIVLP